MVTLSRSDAESWCFGRGVRLDARERPDIRATAESFDIPNDAGRRIAVVADHLDGYRAESETLVWFTEWGVWPSGERPHIFYRLRASYGETRPLIEAPAHVFAQSEVEDAISFVTLGVLFLWDVYVVGASGKRLLHFSHDEFGWAAQ